MEVGLSAREIFSFAIDFRDENTFFFFFFVFRRIYDFDLQTKALSLAKEIEYPGYCLLKIAAIDWNAGCHIVTMSTNGTAVFWRRSKVEEAVVTVVLHQSGINCYDWTKVGNRLLLATGGDDAMLRLTAFRFENEWREESTWKDVRLHEAQISGMVTSCSIN